MKPFMLRGSNRWLPNKLEYGKPYWIGFVAVSHEGFEFVLKKNSKFVQVTDDKGSYLWSKKQLRIYFQENFLQFCVELEELTYCI